ncbi:MAG: sn-glycerol-3-phosphate ABC transporter substrate-binding protein UgpB [Betaproteobacteria bacterium]|nr:sn-glycerol-3-phosphate ABC transporter substrate-binding protein UgpB [Betaproteobacteria bacterium]MDH5219786.1 sn-glycerol-3-phosphate ABC transporter substrate-binding protein UgpB [Betaproteobacteria bacterium]MDH5351259.1 sn-glycerol-3-phosphate ABC transporter substrate-binding protein UgpB [Betaproteobacteria bacterium]
MRIKLIAAVIAGAFALPAQAQVEIQWWHSMGGALGEALNGLANKFNESQKEYKVNAIYKGSYPESMTAAIAAYRAKNPPHIVQVFEVGTATMMAAKGAVKPVYQLMKESGEKFDPKAYLPAVAGYYSDTKGNMLSLPFNSSTALFYIDRNKFKAAGLPPVPPKTWKELTATAEKLKAAGQDCVYTTGWPSWVHIENFSAWHNVPIGTKQNGMAGFDTVFQINSPLHVKHVAMLGDMAKKGLFTYAGRTNQADGKFQAGECAMATISAGALAGTIKAGKTDWQLSMLPYHDDVKGAPQNSIIGGASLWVMSGRKAAEYKGVAKFFTFLSQPEIQMEWHIKTGYVPITLAAYELTKKSGFYDQNPGRDMAVLQLTNKAPTANSKGLRFGNFVQGREVFEEEMEAVFAGKKDAKTAMNDAVKRGNEILRKFQAANK